MWREGCGTLPRYGHACGQGDGCHTSRFRTSVDYTDRFIHEQGFMLLLLPSIRQGRNAPLALKTLEVWCHLWAVVVGDERLLGGSSGYLLNWNLSPHTLPTRLRYFGPHAQRNTDQASQRRHFSSWIPGGEWNLAASRMRTKKGRACYVCRGPATAMETDFYSSDFGKIWEAMSDMTPTARAFNLVLCLSKSDEFPTEVQNKEEV